MGNLDETTIVALVVVVGIFGLLALVIVRRSTEDAIKVWSILGVAFGAIISYYFTNRVKDQQIEAVQASVAAQVSKARMAALVNEQQRNSAAITGITSALRAPDLQSDRRAELQRNLEARNVIAKGYEEEINKVQSER